MIVIVYHIANLGGNYQHTIIMKKLSTLALLLLFFISNNYAQEALDSIYTVSEVLAVNVKEVTEESVKFSYPGEEILNTISVATVTQIVFRSGRVQAFAQASSYRAVKNGLDWEYVTVVQNRDELTGLYQLDQVNAKAKAATGWGSVGKMENRAKRKLLIETAMNGGNVVFLTQQNSATRSQNSTSSSVMGGVAYANSVPNYAVFKNMVDGKNEFRFVEKHVLGVNSDDMKVATQKGESVTLGNIEQSGHMIYVTATIPGEDEPKYRVSYFDDQQIILVYRGKKQIVNLILMI